MANAPYGYQDTRFPENAVHIHTRMCVCDDCENGDSINLSENTFDSYLAEDVANGRPLFNATGEPLSVTVVRDKYFPDCYTLEITEDIPVFSVTLPST